MAPNSNSEPSPTTTTLQRRQQPPDNQVEVDVEQQQQPRHFVSEEFQAHDFGPGPGPTHHPSAPPGELFDVQTTIDPSYIISLIRKLLPVDETRGDDNQGLGECNNSVQRADDQTINGVSSPKSNGLLNNSNGDIEMMETLSDGVEVRIPRLPGTHDKDTDPPQKSAREEAWEESGCVLWDLAANKEHAEFMVQNLVLEVLLANLMTSDSARITEISLGIMGNLACHDVLMNQITSTDRLLEMIVDQVFSNDAPCLCEVCRLLTLGLQGSQCAVWARAMQADHILSRVLWIVENTLNPVLIEKSVGLLLAIMENQDVIPILLQPLMNLGLPNLLVNLLASEMGKLRSERMPERYPVLDSILRAVEALSATDGYSEGICSNKEVVQMAVELIKITEKIEISSSCVTAAVLIANILADAPDLAFKLSEDLPLLQSLLDLFPFTSEDLEARNALWSLVARLLVCIQEAEMNPSRLSQYVSMLVDRSDVIEDTLLASDWDSYPESNTLTTSKHDCRSVAIKCFVKILYNWNLVKEEASIVHNDEDAVGSSYADDRDVQKLLDCFLKHAS